MNSVTFGDDKFGYYETVAGGAGAVSGVISLVRVLSTLGFSSVSGYFLFSFYAEKRHWQPFKKIEPHLYDLHKSEYAK